METVAVNDFRALKVRDLVSDSAVPVCLSFILDLNKGFLYLEFDESIVASSLQVTGITLLSSTKGAAVTLSEASGYAAGRVSTANYTVAVVQLAKNDLDLAKLRHQEANLDIIVADQGFVEDFSGNQYPGNTENSGIPRSKLIPDTSPPVLINFKVNMTSGIVVLNFDELVIPESIIPSRIKFSTAAVNGTIVTLSNATRVFQNSDTGGGEVLVHTGLFKFDREALIKGGIGLSRNVTFISIDQVSDILGNFGSISGVQVSELVEDDVYPTLLAFELFPNASTIRVDFFFSSLMVPNFFNCSDFTFQSERVESPSQLYTPHIDDCLVPPSEEFKRYISVWLPISASPLLQNITTNSTLYMSVRSAAVTRYHQGRTVGAILSAFAIRNGPRIADFELNMNAGYADILFTTEMKEQPIPANIIGFYSHVTGVGEYIDAGTPLISLDGVPLFVLRVVFSLETFNSIKLIDVTPQGTIIFANADGILSTENRKSAPLEKDLVKIASSLVVDSARPVLQLLTIDMSYEFILMNFDEPIRVSSIVLTNLKIQWKSDDSREYLLLSGGTINQIRNVLNISLSSADAERIKLNRLLVTNETNSFMSIAFNSLEDYNGNYLSSIPTTSARVFDFFVADVVHPILKSFDLSMNSGELTLIFSEPVQSDLRTEQIRLQSRFFAVDGISYTLDLGIVKTSDGIRQIVDLTQAGVNDIKLINSLARTAASCFLIAGNTTAQDMSGNSLVSVVDGSALLVNAFLGDVTPPGIITMGLDANAEQLRVTFDDLMHVILTDARGAQVRRSADPSSEQYSLSFESAAVLTVPFSSSITVQLSAADSNTLKYRFPLASSQVSTNFLVSTIFAKDVYTNAVQPIPLSSLKNADFYIVDSTPPVLLSFTLNMNAGTMQLQFTETTKQPSFNFDGLTIQSTFLRRFGNDTTLSGSSATVRPDAASTYVDVVIATDVLNSMKRQGIGISVSTSYMSWTDEFVTDVAGNYAPPVLDGSISGYFPMLPSTLTVDALGPGLQTWYLDKDVMVAYFIFNEPVFIREPTSMIITDQGAGVQYPTAFLGATVKSIPNSNKYSVQLSDHCVGGSYGAEGPCAPQEMLFARLLATTNKLYVIGTPSFCGDLAAISNSMLAITEANPKIEGSPNCDPCPEGEFTSIPCTGNSDRVCAQCTVCQSGEFESSSCEQFADTRCSTCSQCPAGKYISTSCSGAQNSICSECTVCGHLEYTQSRCERGANTLCGSCKTCTLSPAIEQTCKSGNYWWWHTRNCFDPESSCQQYPCNTIGYYSMVTSARNGRHHWVYPDTSPEIKGYAFGSQF
jgi:hypothetical protein